ncbi:tumor necrosis factor receptor superfamily member 14-like isoform X1 [Mobula birostris]|uniref:tumor necrosis factor receptor superfamily member 14-like isoform X1 n=1 Tax=Mobula birostris TaxID=1983395 RepID=UPI003B288E1E
METSGVPLLLLGVLAAVRAAPELKCPAKFLSSHQPEGSSCCSGCRPGFFLKEECSKTSKSVCIPCPYGSYSTQWNNLFTCLRCDECGYEGMQYKRNCTRRSNAQCECSKGYICEDSDCRSCITKGGAVTSNPCSSGTFSDTGAEPCRPWTNCTSLGYVEISPGSQMRDTICDYSTKVTPTQRAKESSNKKEVVTAIVAFASLFLLCLSIGLHIATFRKKRRRDCTLSPDEAQAKLTNTLCEKTNNIRYPEQECGGTPCLDTKNMEHASVDTPSV